MKRSLIPSLFDALTPGGQLAELLDYVKRDNTLDMEFRGDKINIYYRGGNILDVKWKNDVATFSFNTGYFLDGKVPSDFATLLNSRNWERYFPVAKQAMDFYLTKKANLEKEFQQLIIFENNRSGIAKGTDFFILDMEYKVSRGPRFDLVAVQWDSHGPARANPAKTGLRVHVIEIKYGDTALANKSGVKSHNATFNTFLKSTYLSDFMNDMQKVLYQKIKLGLIPCLLKKKGGYTESDLAFKGDPEMMFILINHDPESRVMQREFDPIKGSASKFISSNFMGYGLYKENLLSYQQFTNKFSRQF